MARTPSSTWLAPSKSCRRPVSSSLIPSAATRSGSDHTCDRWAGPYSAALQSTLSNQKRPVTRASACSADLQPALRLPDEGSELIQQPGQECPLLTTSALSSQNKQ